MNGTKVSHRSAHIQQMLTAMDTSGRWLERIPKSTRNQTFGKIEWFSETKEELYLFIHISLCGMIGKLIIVLPKAAVLVTATEWWCEPPARRITSTTTIMKICRTGDRLTGCSMLVSTNSPCSAASDGRPWPRAGRPGPRPLPWRASFLRGSIRHRHRPRRRHHRHPRPRHRGATSSWLSLWPALPASRVSLHIQSVYWKKKNIYKTNPIQQLAVGRVTVDVDASFDFAQRVFGNAAVSAHIRFVERVDGQHHLDVERLADFRLAVFASVLANVSSCRQSFHRYYCYSFNFHWNSIISSSVM